MSTPERDSKVVVVTGASSGIGSAVAERLATEGHHVVAVARRAERLDELSVRIGDTAGGLTTMRADVTDRVAMENVVEKTLAAHGRLDVVVNNAGVMPLSPLRAGHVHEWDRMIDVNVRGLLHGIAAALPVFENQGAGHFVTVASVGAHEVSPTAAVYCGTKYAAWAITEGLRLETDPGIRVTTISPGVVESELADTITDSEAAAAMRTYRAHTIPADAIARAVSYALDQPSDVDVNEIVVRPAQQR
ncbi:SDR family oxidoreductase [Prauserella rugosa]|uniref:NADP-dependent 3-hydroxy acid dehydrogenase YdfG n=1 Tax=Prauserella rugosa TaxID=43354 RepID=A0A660CEA3_9PSEU|nr:SDR family oxidoreductase [Prauserella rugosa]KMS90665.1 oxidoreductase [Streptomyces regensis]TWH20734.1 NADP-dependent 3-hydroxy acid dehydrogenase YdfG [Prauserella rugosa]